MNIQPGKYHSPMWTLETEISGYPISFMVWAPREATEHEQARTQWQASWDNLDNEMAGDCRKADSLLTVLETFDAFPEVRQAFIDYFIANPHSVTAYLQDYPNKGNGEADYSYNHGGN